MGIASHQPRASSIVCDVSIEMFKGHQLVDPYRKSKLFDALMSGCLTSRPSFYFLSRIHAFCFVSPSATFIVFAGNKKICHRR